ncbi:hypothetical protein GCM10011610_44360 [Nocardia rhizosphaerihabitans]|uniref:Uncharacterized protein n=1 Tax=Nocardia rhizosphaerihabitans TaxID=1691570 RepID=A0ABQ2KPQ1_9NOCA|nr:hypothetical protein GCM10011610_44360 [Nocardia rhizosphaerihabitans]
MITWNDLSYSLSPDGAVGPAGRGKGGTGATKSTWVTGLATIGVLSPGVEGSGTTAGTAATRYRAS